MKQIKTTRALRQALAAGHREFRLCLQFGLYSRKTITLLADGRFRIVHHIDDSVQTLTGRQLHSHSNLGAAMRVGALITSS